MVICCGQGRYATCSAVLPGWPAASATCIAKRVMAEQRHGATGTYENVIESSTSTLAELNARGWLSHFKVTCWQVYSILCPTLPSLCGGRSPTIKCDLTECKGVAHERPTTQYTIAVDAMVRVHYVAGDASGAVDDTDTASRQFQLVCEKSFTPRAGEHGSWPLSSGSSSSSSCSMQQRGSLAAGMHLLICSIQHEIEHEARIHSSCCSAVSKASHT